MAPGTATITAGTGTAQITVYEGPELPEGTVKWRVPGDGTTLWDTIPAVPSPDGVADVFAVYDSKVQAITADGHVAWTAPYSGLVIPDFQGGYLDAGDTIQKHDGKTGSALPAFNFQNFSWWVFGVHTDGTVFAVDGNNIIGVNPVTGQQKFSIPFPTGTNSVTNDCPNQTVNSSTPTDAYWGPTDRLHVAGDGYLYLNYGIDNSTSTTHCEDSYDGTGLLLHHSRTGTASETSEDRVLRVGSDGSHLDLWSKRFRKLLNITKPPIVWPTEPMRTATRSTPTSITSTRPVPAKPI